MGLISRFIEELRRRQVFSVVVIYIAAAWVLLQVVDVDVIQDTFGVDAQLVLIAAIVGFPFALVAGWFYDINKKGIFRTAPAADDGSFEPRLGAADFAVFGVLAIVWAAIVYFTYVPPATDRSLAVMPFENRSHDPDSEIFAFGVRDDLNVYLGRVRELRVIAPDSVDRVDQSLPVDRIGIQLGVAYLLKGSVDRIADRIRINVTLIDSVANTQAWAGSFDRELSTEGLFDTRSEIADAITLALRATLTDAERRGLDDRPTENLAAWETYLRGRYLLAQRTPNSVIAAVSEFEKAITTDPDFALGHAEFAIALLIAEPDDTPWDQLLAKVEHHVEMAMALNPGLAEAHAAKGRLFWNKGRLFGNKGDIDAALIHYRRAIDINPSFSDAYVVMAEMYVRQAGRHEETITALGMAVRLDPLSRHGNFDYVAELIARNRLHEADQQIEKFASIDPRGAIVLRGIRSSIGGNWSNFILAYLNAAKNGRNDLVFGDWAAWDMMWQLAAIGLEEEARLITKGEEPEVEVWFGDTENGIALARAQLAADPDAFWTPMMGFMLAHAGHYAEARPYLEGAWQQPWGGRFARDDFYSVYLAEALVAVRRDAGDELGAGEVLEELRKNVRRFRDAGVTVTQWIYSVDYHEGIAAYLAGDRETGLALISKAAEDGFWIPPVSAFQESRFQDPDFASILERQSARQAREREKVLAVVCTDNPYKTVWNPSDETCEQFRRSGDDQRNR